MCVRDRLKERQKEQLGLGSIMLSNACPLQHKKCMKENKDIRDIGVKECWEKIKRWRDVVRKAF